MSAPDLSRQASPAERTPYDGAHSLIDPQRHQLLLVVTTNHGIIDLMPDIAGPSILIRDGQRLHQMPAGEIGTGDVAHLAAAHQGVQGIERLLHRRERVESVEMVDVDVVGSQALEAGLTGMHQVQPAGADIVGSVAHRKSGLSGYQDL